MKLILTQPLEETYWKTKEAKYNEDKHVLKSIERGTANVFQS